VPIEAALTKDMLFIRNLDKPGLIGALGTILGNAKQNIADFRLGRAAGGDSAVCLVSLDAPISSALFAEVSNSGAGENRQDSGVLSLGYVRPNFLL
jgi:D-3-phosphoglycerate dehydrogenase / 2-oxoglutarate reductase